MHTLHNSILTKPLPFSCVPSCIVFVSTAQPGVWLKCFKGFKSWYFSNPSIKSKLNICLFIYLLYFQKHLYWIHLLLDSRILWNFLLISIWIPLLVVRWLVVWCCYWRLIKLKYINYSFAFISISLHWEVPVVASTSYSLPPDQCLAHKTCSGPSSSSYNNSKKNEYKYISCFAN